MCNFVESSKYFESLDPEKFEQIYQTHQQKAESNNGCLNTLAKGVAGFATLICGVAAPVAAALVCVAVVCTPFIWVPALVVAFIAPCLILVSLYAPEESSLKDKDVMNSEFKEFVKNKCQTTDEVPFHIDSKYTHFQFHAKKWEEKLAVCQQQLDIHPTEELFRQKIAIQFELNLLSHNILGCSYTEGRDIDALLEKEINDLKWDSIISRCVQVTLSIFAILAMVTVLVGGVIAGVIFAPVSLAVIIATATTLFTLATPMVFVAVAGDFRKEAVQANTRRTLLENPEYKAYLKAHAKKSFDALAKMRDAAFAHQFRMAKPRAELAAFNAKSPAHFNQLAEEKYRILQRLSYGV